MSEQRLIDANALFEFYRNEYKSCLYVHRRERAAGFQGALQLLYDAHQTLHLFLASSEAAQAGEGEKETNENA